MVHHRYGPADVLEVAQVADPAVGPRDVLVRVHAAAVNPVDLKMRAGSHRVVVPRRLPWVLGLDVSGVVEAVGDRVDAVKPGDEVMASPGHRRWGTYAELVAIDVSEVAPKPAALSHEEAAALPLVGLTAWQCLQPHIQPGHRVFVQAGSGGVGTVAIQIAKHLGASWVATTCSAPNHALVRSLGADLAIDYRALDHGEVLADIDVALESLIGEPRRRTVRAMRRGGRMSFVSTGLPEYVARWGGIVGTLGSGFDTVWFMAQARAAGVRSGPVVRRADGQQLATLGQLAEEGALRPVVERTFDMAEAAEAHRHVETGRTRGKVVLRAFGA